MLSARDAANLVPLDPRQVLNVIEDQIRAAAVQGHMMLETNFGVFATGSGPLFDAAVSVLVGEGYTVNFDQKWNETTISWG